MSPQEVRAAIYARVSDFKGGRSRSVPEQLTDGRAVVILNGWTPAGEYSDTDRSASRHAKPSRKRLDWQLLLDEIGAGHIDMVVLWEFSRGTRDRRVGAALMATCQDAGVKLCVGGRVYDLDDPDDAFALDLQMGLSVRESDVTRKRVMRAMVANAEAGRPHGRTSFGWRRIYDPSTGALLRQEIEPDQAAVIRDACARVLAGESIASIVRDLNARGVPTAHGAGVWTRPVLRALLVKPAIAGLRQHHRKVVGPGLWPAIVSEGDWLALLDKLTGTPAQGRPGSLRHLATGIDGPLRCGRCGAGMRPGRYPSGLLAYRCLISCVSAPVEDVDRLLGKVAVARLSRPDAASLLRRGDPAAARAAKAEEAELQQQLDGFVDAAADGQLSPSALARIEQRLQPRIDEAKRRAALVGVPAAVADLVTADDVEAAWEALEVHTQREVLCVLGPFVLAPADRLGARIFDHTRITWPEKNEK